MVQIFLFGLIAYAVAQPLSSLAAYFLLTMVADAINIVLQGYRTKSSVVLLQLVIALIVPQVAGIIPIIQGTRITAVEALSGYNQAQPPSSHDWFSQLIHQNRGLPRPLVLSLRNTFRRRVRLILDLIYPHPGGGGVSFPPSTPRARCWLIISIRSAAISWPMSTSASNSRTAPITSSRPSKKCPVCVMWKPGPPLQPS